MLIQNMKCTGSHGISVGSLGQYPGAYDIVENIYVYNTSLINATVSVFPSIKVEVVLTLVPRTAPASKSGPTLHPLYRATSKVAEVTDASTTSLTTL